MAVFANSNILCSVFAKSNKVRKSPRHMPLPDRDEMRVCVWRDHLPAIWFMPHTICLMTERASERKGGWGGGGAYLALFDHVEVVQETTLERWRETHLHHTHLHQLQRWRQTCLHHTCHSHVSCQTAMAETSHTQLHQRHLLQRHLHHLSVKRALSRLPHISHVHHTSEVLD